MKNREIRKVLVTGHKGFIGRYVFDDWFSTNGYLVRGLDMPSDIANFEPEEDYDVVIHLAAFANIRDSLKDPESFYTNNVVKAKKLFDWCRETDTRLLYASSSAVDGNYWDNPYAMTKWINEQMAPPNSVGMRFTTVYGPNSRKDMLYRMLEDRTATYLTNHKRDWIHVKDVARAIRYLAVSDLTGPVPVGTGNGVYVTELAKKMGMGHLPVTEHTPGESYDNTADTTLLRSTGWFPTENVVK